MAQLVGVDGPSRGGRRPFGKSNWLVLEGYLLSNLSLESAGSGRFPHSLTECDDASCGRAHSNYYLSYHAPSDFRRHAKVEASP